MSLRLNTRSRLDQLLTSWASARLIKQAQEAEDALATERDIRRNLEAQHRQELANMRAEYDSAVASLRREFEIEVELTRRLGKACNLGFVELCVLRVQAQDAIRKEDERAEFDAIVSRIDRAMPAPRHPSNGEAS